MGSTFYIVQPDFTFVKKEGKSIDVALYARNSLGATNEMEFPAFTVYYGVLPGKDNFAVGQIGARGQLVIAMAKDRDDEALDDESVIEKHLYLLEDSLPYREFFMEISQEPVSPDVIWDVLCIEHRLDFMDDEEVS